MDLKFILSLGFNQVSLEESDCNGVGVFLKGRQLDIHDGIVHAGIFKHIKTMKLFVVFYDEKILIGMYEVSTGFIQFVELCTTIVGWDRDLYKEIIKKVTKVYTNKKN